jgi:hypothetical protein
MNPVDRLGRVLSTKGANSVKTNPHFTPAPFSRAEYIAVLGLQASSLALLAAAFYVAADGLTPDQRQITAWLFALQAGASGYFFGGVVLKFTGKWGPAASFAIRAVGASALFLSVLVLAPFPRAAGSEGYQNAEGGDALALRVTSPSEGAKVGPTAEVHGHTMHQRWAHYLEITSLDARADVIQDSTIKVEPDGGISSLATFGATAVGVGQRYSIRFIDSKTPFMPGLLKQGPHVIVSPAVTVTRTW